MKKKLSRSGSGWALFMPKTLLELIDVNPEIDLVEIKVENNTVKVTKADIDIIKKGLIKMKDNLEMISIKENISKGYLIRLNCGHNNTLPGVQENTIVEILEQNNFLK